MRVLMVIVHSVCSRLPVMQVPCCETLVENLIEPLQCWSHAQVSTDVLHVFDVNSRLEMQDLLCEHSEQAHMQGASKIDSVAGRAHAIHACL